MKNKKVKKQKEEEEAEHSNARIEYLACNANDVEFLILSRLPLSTLVQCTAVCKSWRTLLTGFPSVLHHSASLDTSWLALHKCTRPKDCLTVYSPASNRWFNLGPLPRGRPDRTTSSSGHICCAYSHGKTAQLTVYNPLFVPDKCTPRYTIALRKSAVSSFEILNMWKRIDGYGVIAAGPASTWGSTWEIWVWDSEERSLTRHRASVDIITGGRGLLSLMCSTLVGEDMFSVWGMHSVPRILVKYGIRRDSWEIIHDSLPMSWRCSTFSAGKRRYNVQVLPNLLELCGKLAVVSLREEVDALGVKLWGLEGGRGWEELGFMPEPMWEGVCKEIKGGVVESSLYIRAVGSSSGNLVYVVMDWGWRIKIAVHELRVGRWRWLPWDGTDALGFRLDNCIFCLDPEVCT